MPNGQYAHSNKLAVAGRLHYSSKDATKHSPVSSSWHLGREPLLVRRQSVQDVSSHSVVEADGQLATGHMQSHWLLGTFGCPN